ncbi:hypothetical protein BD410DRAFT_32147 [Rickenella mellea]|uniref:polynucleotide adenylyltransferase n=1 Tax=Rickenella mellea TaxID=50990 RepID=A0A4R5XES5_9AGAM|nr:hypothetical protein BD410DRAFT_32147 [Rickenella mellea]
MASYDKAPLDCYSTALVLIPSSEIQSRLNILRSANDKSFPRWTSHITLIYPFVQPNRLQHTLSGIRNAITRQSVQPFELELDHIDRFKAREYDTIYVAPSNATRESVHHLWSTLADVVGYQGRAFVPHLTIGQARNNRDGQLLDAKGKQILRRGLPRWLVESVVVLQKDETDSGRMKVVDEICLAGAPRPKPTSIIPEGFPTYCFEIAQKEWRIATNVSFSPYSPGTRDIKVVTFNVLHDMDHDAVLRFEDIKSTLIKSRGDVLCMQEVTDALLGLLLADTDVQSTWTWCSRGCDTVMESERNVVVFTKHHLPFSWKRVVLSGKHKSAAVLSISIIHPVSKASMTIALANFHLTAGLSEQHLRAKSQEFKVLIHYLNENHADHEWILAGDTNFPNTYQIDPEVEFAIDDVWSSYHGTNTLVSGFTYDPSQNTLAAATVRADKSAHRYDRIFLKRSTSFHIMDAELLVDSPASPASDHWPLSASLSFIPLLSNSVELNGAGSSIETVHSTQLEDGPMRDDLEADFVALLDTTGMLPNHDERTQRSRAIDMLCITIGAFLGDRMVGGYPGQQSSEENPLASHFDNSPVHLILVPVGSYAMGVDFVDSDVDCIVVGNVSAPTFWALVKQKIRGQTHRSRDDQVKLRRHVKDAAVQMMVLECAGIKIDLQYCPAAQIVECWESLEEQTSDSPLFSLPVSSLRVLNAHRDWRRLSSIIPNLQSFRLALRSIKLFCVRHGIYASRYGYLGGLHITILLTQVAINQANSASASELVRNFFHVYSAFVWESDEVHPSGVETTYKRKGREPMVILSPEKPVRNVSASASTHTLAAIRKEFSVAHEMLSHATPWSQVCGTEGSAINDFLRGFTSYVKLHVCYWGSSCMRGRALVGFVESRLVHLLVELHSTKSTTTARLWPLRFVDSPTEQHTKSASVDGFYLIGLSMHNHMAKPLSGPLQAFEDSVRNNEDYYNSTEAFISVSQVSRESLKLSIVPDRHIWSDDGIDQPDSSDDELDDVPENPSNEESNELPISANQRKKQQRHARSKVTSHIPAQKLRTSEDVYNRLLWDPHLNQDDYVIGYDDRFQGVKQMPLQNWKRDVDDEAFIPMHRIVHFMRKSDGKVLWDRQSKTDYVFGSGVLAQSPNQ